MSVAPFLAVAIQYRASVDDYATAGTFSAAMHERMEAVRPLVQPDLPTLVALPEDIGLGLLLCDMLPLVRGCSSLLEAVGVLVEACRGEIEQDPAARDLTPVQGMLRVLTRRKVEPVYRCVFSGLAREYGVYLSAGSAPMLRNGAGAPGNGSYFFAPDGTLLSRQLKVHLMPIEGDEGVGMSAGLLRDLETVNLPFAQVGVAICLDAFQEDILSILNSLQSDVLVQPSFNPEPWTDEKAEDWKGSSWKAVQTSPNLRVALNPMMVGGFFDLQAEGRSSISVSAARTPDGTGYVARASTHDANDIVSAVVSW